MIGTGNVASGHRECVPCQMTNPPEQLADDILAKLLREKRVANRHARSA